MGTLNVGELGEKESKNMEKKNTGMVCGYCCHHCISDCDGNNQDCRDFHALGYCEKNDQS